MNRCISLLLWLIIPFTTIYAEDFWQPTKGPYGGFSQSLAITPDGTVFVGTWNGGVFYSTNEATSWTGTNPTIGHFYTLTVDHKGGLWGTKVNSKAGLFYSADHGKTWEVKLDSVLRYYHQLLILPDKTMLLTRGQGHPGIWRSTDEGTTWTYSDDFHAPYQEIVMSPVYDFSDGTLYAGVAADIFTSVDHGLSWQRLLTTQSSIKYISILPEGLVFTDKYSNNIYYLPKGSKSPKQVLKSDAAITLCTTIGDSLILVGTINGYLLSSRDHGQTWQQQQVARYSIFEAKQSSTGVLYLTTPDGVLSSRDGGSSWQDSNNGIIAQDIQIVLADSRSGNIWVSNERGDIFRSTDYGESWTENRLGVPIRCFLQTSEQTLLAGSTGTYENPYSKGVFISNDNGISWQPFNEGLKDTTIRGFGKTKDGEIYVGTQSAGVFRLQPDRSVWEKTPLNIDSIWSIMVDSSDNIFAGTSEGKIYVSADKGQTWTMHKLSGNSGIQAMAQGADGTLYAATYDTGLFSSTDGGNTWVDAGLGQNILMAVVIDRQGTVYAAGKGCYVRKKDTDIWTDIGQNVPALYDFNFNTLFLSTDGTPWAGTLRGLLKGSSAISSVAANQAPLVQMTAYPNPVTIVSTIGFTLPAPMDITVEIYNHLGIKIETIIKGFMEAGAHTAMWNTVNVPTGLYYCQLSYGSYTETRNLIVLK